MPLALFDCLHYCLPGPPDDWNRVLRVLLLQSPAAAGPGARRVLVNPRGLLARASQALLGKTGLVLDKDVAVEVPVDDPFAGLDDL